jgi:hypothetical protein
MVSHETGRRIDDALRSWGRFVLWTRVVLAIIGVLIMTFFAIVAPDSRLVTIPSALAALTVAVWTLRSLRRPASGPSMQGTVDK